MKTFKDSADREWTVDITTSALRRVRDGLNYNLGDTAILHQTIPKLLSDDLFVVEVAWWLVQPQAMKNRVTEESFVDSMFGDVIAPAAIAIEQELKGFFRNPGTRDLVERFSATAREQMEAAIKSLSTSSSTSTDSPASSESTPTT